MNKHTVTAIYIVCVTIFVILTIGEYDLLDAIIERVSV